ncbi:MAG: hypothetical protein J7L52_01860 [Thermotogae bacterium]|nr:hypothetical protein [Thermotogota bacterium]
MRGLMYFLVSLSLLFLLSCGAQEREANITTPEEHNTLDEVAAFIARDLTSSLATDSRITVMNFKASEQDVPSELIELLSNEIVNAMINEARVMVLDRDFMDMILEEHKMQLAGITEEESVQIGKLMGADYVLTGQVLLVGEEYNVYARIIDVQTSKIVASCKKGFRWEERKREKQPEMRTEEKARVPSELEKEFNRESLVELTRTLYKSRVIVSTGILDIPRIMLSQFRERLIVGFDLGKLFLRKREANIRLIEMKRVIGELRVSKSGIESRNMKYLIVGRTLILVMPELTHPEYTFLELELGREKRKYKLADLLRRVVQFREIPPSRELYRSSHPIIPIKTIVLRYVGEKEAILEITLKSNSFGVLLLEFPQIGKVVGIDLLLTRLQPEEKTPKFLTLIPVRDGLKLIFKGIDIQRLNMVISFVYRGKKIRLCEIP